MRGVVRLRVRVWVFFLCALSRATRRDDGPIHDVCVSVQL